MARRNIDTGNIVTIDSLEKVLPIAEDILYRVADELNEDVFAMKPARWKYVLSCVFNEVIYPNRRLLYAENVKNGYDQYAIKYLYLHVYKVFSNRYNQRISQVGFEYFSGIDNQTIYNWSNDTGLYKNDNPNLNSNIFNYINNSIDNTIDININVQCILDKLSTLKFDLYKQIKKDSEESTVDIMFGDTANSTKYIAYLNRHHNWNGAGTTSERARAQMLTAADLPKLCLPETDNNGITGD